MNSNSKIVLAMAIWASAAASACASPTEESSADGTEPAGEPVGTTEQASSRAPSCVKVAGQGWVSEPLGLGYVDVRNDCNQQWRLTLDIARHWDPTCSLVKPGQTKRFVYDRGGIYAFRRVILCDS